MPKSSFGSGVAWGGDTVDGSKIPNNHVGYIKPCKYRDIYHINWCRISSINSRMEEMGVVSRVLFWKMLFF